MATSTLYEYKVRDASGKLVTGKLEAADEAALISRLRAQGHAPLSVRQIGRAHV